MLAAFASSCWLPFSHKRVRVFVPPPAVRRQVEIPEQPEIPEPHIELVAMILPPEYPATFPVIPPPPAPPKRLAQPPVRATAPPAPPQPEPPPTPKIGQLFTADEFREYNRSLDDSLEYVRRALAIVGGKNLNPEQLEATERIRTFQKQAEQARDQDLLTAVGLAKRAFLLAQDLLSRVQ